MAQLERNQRSCESPKSLRAQTSPTFEQLLRAEDAEWSSGTSASFGSYHDQDQETSPNSKKSVLTKVKERARKLKYSLSGKKRHENEHEHEHGEQNTTPSWCVTLDDDDDGGEMDEDPEFLGAPMYESEFAPENYIEHARQHPRADPVLSEKHVLPSSGKFEAVDQENSKHVSPNKSRSEPVSQKLAPNKSVVSGETQALASKMSGLTITTPEAQERATTAVKVQGEPRQAAREVESKSGLKASDCGDEKPHEKSGNFSKSVRTASGSDGEKLAEKSRNLSKSDGSSQKWDKGVSVKEYFLNKLEPGEDEKALSQAITEAMSPRRSAGSDSGVVEKVKEAVTSLFWHEEPSHAMAKGSSTTSAGLISQNHPAKTSDGLISPYLPSYAQQDMVSNARSSKMSRSASANTSRHLPNSTNAHQERAKENLGRVLQTN